MFHVAVRRCYSLGNPTRTKVSFQLGSRESFSVQVIDFRRQFYFKLSNRLVNWCYQISPARISAKYRG